MNSQVKLAIASIAVSTFLSACATAPRADLSGATSADEEISRLNADIQEGYRQQYDVLANKDFEKSQEYLEEAKEDLKDGDEIEDIMESLSISRGYLQRASGTAQARSTQVDGILLARDAALNSNVRRDKELSLKMKDLDDDLRSEADEFQEMSSEEINRYQEAYLALEVKGTQMTQLGAVRQQVKAAEARGAASSTPRTLARARKDLVTAENDVATNVRAPEAFMDSVNRAKESAQLLTDVVAAAHQEGKVIPESVALGIVGKNKQISSMGDQVGDLSSELGSTQSALASASAAAIVTGQELEEKEQKVQSQALALKMEQAIDSVSKEFSKDEAEVYQQGDKVVIRLKGMGFGFGKSEIPTDAQPLLQKVSEVANDLNATNVIVEGHTDSIGDSAINEKLSKDRAQAVAAFLSEKNDSLSSDKIQSIGYGFKKPLMTNKTREGRAQNRRVDVIISAGTVEQ